jgi:hypothetical protein
MRSATPFWMGSAALALGRTGGAVWRTGDNGVVWMASEQPTVQANLLEGTSPPGTITWQTPNGDLFRSTVNIPKIGCWEILASTKDQNLRAIVYVYSARYFQ